MLYNCLLFEQELTSGRPSLSLLDMYPESEDEPSSPLEYSSLSLSLSLVEVESLSEELLSESAGLSYTETQS
jgi:hypothetical protein